MDRKIEMKRNSIEASLEYSEKLHKEIKEKFEKGENPKEKVLKHSRLLISIANDVEELDALMSKTKTQN